MSQKYLDILERVVTIKEGKKEVKQKYVDTGKLPEDIFIKFIEGDPTGPKGKYLDWMAKTYVANPERADHMLDVIKMFHRLALRKRIDKSDVYQYRTLEELEKAAIEADKTMSKTQAKKKTKEESSTVVMDNDRVLIVVPETYEISKTYGHDTKWCTALTSTDHHWKSYYREGCKLYYIIAKKERSKYYNGPAKYAVLVRPNGQKTVYDEQDKEMDFDLLQKKLGL
jgi:hypothetical protein